MSRSPTAAGRVLRAVSIGVFGALVLGPPAAMALVVVVRERKIGCSATMFDGAHVWVCPDGIAYLLPALVVIAIVGALALWLGVATEFRGTGADVRRTGAAHLAAWTGGALAVVGGLLAVAGVALGGPMAVAMGLIAVVTGGMPVLMRTRWTPAGLAAWSVLVALVLVAAITAGEEAATFAIPAFAGFAGVGYLLLTARRAP